MDCFGSLHGKKIDLVPIFEGFMHEARQTARAAPQRVFSEFWVNMRHIYGISAFTKRRDQAGKKNMAQEKTFNMEEEFAGLDFHSLRFAERFIRTMETFSKQPGAAIGEGSEKRVETSD
jgi:hypothetical protein